METYQFEGRVFWKVFLERSEDVTHFIQCDRMVVRVLVKQENIVTDHDAMAENKQHVVPGRILLAAEFKELLQRDERIQLTRSLASGLPYDPIRFRNECAAIRSRGG